MKAAGCSGATIVFSDRPEKLSDAAVISHDELKDAYDSYDNGILDLTDPRTFADLEILVQQIFMFMDKVRVGGRVIVPESTYCHLPYGIEGMEILFRVSGMLMELPSADESGLLIATVQE
jgi:predicted membrane-bound spermidine synthase